jgi:hypothetical protein
MAKVVIRNRHKSASQSVPRGGKMWWVAGGIALLLIVAGAIASQSMRGSTSPADRDYSTSQISDQGLFRVSYAADGVQINQMHEWTIHVETADGEPVENAQITVDGGMPEHGHGLPTVPQVTDYLGDGDYRVEGVRFQMQGWWIVTFHISADGSEDTVTFNLTVE